MPKKKVGLTLAGGGGKGAYQIGVWRALRKSGLEQYITSVSGTSVGGINAVLFVQGDLEKAEEVWKNISNDVILAPKNPFDKLAKSFSFFSRGGLVKLIEKYLDMDRFKQDKRNCWLACVRLENSESEYITADGSKYVTDNVDYFNLKKADNETITKTILATSAIPVIFPVEEIDGRRYVDGGVPFLGGDNVPAAPLCVVDKCDIVLGIHLEPMDEPIVRHDFEGTRIYEIFPRKSLGSMLDFDPDHAQQKRLQGYEDTINLFRSIKDTIDSNEELIADLKTDLEWMKIASDRHRVLQAQFIRLQEQYGRS